MSGQQILFSPERAARVHRYQVEASIGIQLVHDLHLVVADEGHAGVGKDHISAVSIYPEIDFGQIEARKVPRSRESTWDPSRPELQGSAVLCPPPFRHHKHGVVNFGWPQKQIYHGEHVHTEVDQSASAAHSRVELPCVSLLAHPGVYSRDEGVRIKGNRSSEPSSSEVIGDRRQVREQPGKVTRAHVTIRVHIDRRVQGAAIRVGHSHRLLDQDIDTSA